MRVIDAAVPLERDDFMRRLLTELAASLEAVVGLEEASGYIALAGQRMGDALGDLYTRELELDNLDRHQIAEVLVDLYRRIQGDFYIVSQDEDRIVLGNRTCPFGAPVLGNEALCTMTSSVFGNLTARYLGYAKVDLTETIARHHARCMVVIHLNPGPDADRAPGNEYYGGFDEFPATLPPCVGGDGADGRERG
ncbi:putative ArsR family transcriptional regulator [Nocardiopsis mwathae]|uniref:Putative ArsR family transcriptional regulator n=1 Tax=Nocardiopsis mwathae TaxID=1472723 RepID=A0A7X0D3Q5_9ACTN|nr:methanogen output domain 1-containing protein [Nocardiopsis mwathae]MBB6169986.1 putative ArsR family transcriptional regulator [Nocardiopsis mwathae]